MSDVLLPPEGSLSDICIEKPPKLYLKTLSEGLTWMTAHEKDNLLLDSRR